MNPLNTKYNKAVYVGAFSALSTLIFIGLRDFGGVEVTTDFQGAWMTAGSAIIALMVPNKES